VLEESEATVSLALGYPTIPPEMVTNCDVTLVSPQQIFNSAVLEKQDIANVPARDLDTPYPVMSAMASRVAWTLTPPLGNLISTKS